jgi:hypothetical protein
MFCMPTWQPQLPALAASFGESFTCLWQSLVQVLHSAKSSPWLAQAAARCRIRICMQTANSYAAEFASACRLPMSSLSNSSTAQFSSAYPPDEFSCVAWTVHRQANVRQQSALPIFLWWTYSRTNLCYRFLPCWHGCQHPQGLFWPACQSVHPMHIWHCYIKRLSKRAYYQSRAFRLCLLCHQGAERSN